MQGGKFDGMEFYLSAAMLGEQKVTKQELWGTANYLMDNGGNVLSLHVAALTPEDSDRIFLERTGKDLRNHPFGKAVVCAVDMYWVKQKATHFIAFVGGASTGVGRELEAFLSLPHKPPVLALIHEDDYAKGSGLVVGLEQIQRIYREDLTDFMMPEMEDQMYPQYKLAKYRSEADILFEINAFLSQ